MKTKILSILLCVIIALSAIPVAASAQGPEASFDARDNGWVTSVKNQGNLGFCWAFSGVSVLESEYISKGFGTAENTDFSEAYLIWFAKNPRLTEENMAFGDGENITDVFIGVDINCEEKAGGNSEEVAGVLASGSGIAREEDYPYYRNEISKMGNYSESERFLPECDVCLESYVRFEKNESDAIKSWIKTHGSVTVNYYHDDNFYSNTGKEKTGECAYFTSEVYEDGINHEVAVIGWDDNFSVDNFLAESKPSGNGAWLCKNSWGKNFGDNGYFWLSYEDVNIGTFSGFSLAKKNECQNLYSYNGRLSNTRLKTVAKDVRLANVFVAEESEKLFAVTLFDFAEKTEMTVCVYTDIADDFANPECGKLVASKEHVVTESGYETVELGTEIYIEKGSRFSVVVKMKGTGEEISYPVECGDLFSSRRNESFICKNGIWIDCLDTDRKYNNTTIGALAYSEHEFVTTENVAPSCTSQGCKKNECQKCHRETVEYFESIGHTWGEWYTVNAPTEQAEGLEKRVCATCKEAEERVLEKLPSEDVPPQEKPTTPEEPPKEEPTTPENPPEEELPDPEEPSQEEPDIPETPSQNEPEPEEPSGFFSFFTSFFSGIARFFVNLINIITSLF